MICLCMIVKNEEKIIMRCLNSCLGIIDCLCITDTGSTDETVKMIQRWCEENSITGVIKHSEFQDFGTSRTISYENAKESFPKADYLLLLDADMVLSQFGFDKALTKPYYHVQQTDNVSSYWNIRLISLKNKWECLGVTHEIWLGTTNDFWSKRYINEDCKLTTLKIRDIDDGSSRKNKNKRDIELLVRALAIETREFLITRYQFYLAMTYQCVEKYKLAIEWYNFRINKGGLDQEEIYYSKFKKATCYHVLYNKSKNEDDLMNARHAYIEAWKKRPCRAEPLYYLSSLELTDESSQGGQLAYFYLIQADKIPFPKNDTLFVEYKIYEWKIKYQLMTVAYLARDNECEKRVIRELLAIKDNLPKEVVDCIENHRMKCPVSDFENSHNF